MGASQSIEVCQTCCSVFSQLVHMQRTWNPIDYFNTKSNKLLFFDGSNSLQKSAQVCPSCRLVLRLIRPSVPITDGLYVMALERSVYRDGTYRVELTAGTSLLNNRTVGFLDCFANRGKLFAMSKSMYL